MWPTSEEDLSLPNLFTEPPTQNEIDSDWAKTETGDHVLHLTGSPSEPQLKSMLWKGEERRAKRSSKLDWINLTNLK